MLRVGDGEGVGGVARHPTIESKTRTMRVRPHREPHRTRLICINCVRTEALCKSIPPPPPPPHTLLQLHTLEQRRAI